MENKPEKKIVANQSLTITQLRYEDDTIALKIEYDGLSQVEALGLLKLYTDRVAVGMLEQMAIPLTTQTTRKGGGE